MTDEQHSLFKLRSTVYGALIGIVLLDRSVPELFSGYAEDFDANIVTLMAVVPAVILWWLLDPFLIRSFSGRGAAFKRALSWLGIAGALLITVVVVVISVVNSGTEGDLPDSLVFRGAIAAFFYVVPMVLGLSVLMAVAELIIRAARRYQD